MARGWRPPFLLLLLLVAAPFPARAEPRTYACSSFLEAVGLLTPWLGPLSGGTVPDTAAELEAFHAVVVATGVYWTDLPLLYSGFPAAAAWPGWSARLARRRGELAGLRWSASSLLVLPAEATPGEGRSPARLAAILDGIGATLRYEPATLLLSDGDAAFAVDRAALLMSHAAAGGARVTAREIHELAHALVERGPGRTAPRYRWTIASLDGVSLAPEVSVGGYGLRARSDEPLAFALTALTALRALADVPAGPRATAFAREALAALPLAPVRAVAAFAVRSGALLAARDPSIAVTTATGTCSARVGDAHWQGQGEGDPSVSAISVALVDIAGNAADTARAGEALCTALAELAVHGDVARFLGDGRVRRAAAALETAHDVERWLAGHRLSLSRLATLLGD